jgi:peptidoglycan/xylan/chitin deacetylase (PgdA/CDA1 family)
MARLGIPSTLFVPTGYLASPPGWIPVLHQQLASSGLVASADAVAATNRSLVRVGSHTVTHPNLVSQPADALHAELTSSKQVLERITGSPVRMLSFPYGSFNTGVLAAAGAVGYDRVFANVPVFAGARPGAQLLGRINVSPRDWRLEFQLKVRGAYNWMALAVPVKRALVGFLKGARLR